MPEYSGWKGRVLHIDLSSHTHTQIRPAKEIYNLYLGGRGLAGYYMRPHCTETWDSPSMPLLFFAGPVTDTLSPLSGRFTVLTKSPLSGTISDSSAGGNFGVQIKRTGFDGIIITGKSPRPCGISIKHGTVEFHDATRFINKTVPEIFSSLPGTGATAATGPAAEKGVLFAGIAFTGNSFAGRGGAGLVMASKHLKYIHLEGEENTVVHDAQGLDSARSDILRLTAASPVLGGELGFSEYGTGSLYDLIHSRRMMPTENFRMTLFPHAPGMNAWSLKQKFGSSRTGCERCHILCKKISDNGKHIPEYETMSHFSALVGNSSLDIMMEAATMCDNAGIDTISAASSIACYIEIHDLQAERTDTLKILDDIISSTGEGETLKYGSARYAALHGREELSMSVKGLELPAYDPRGGYGMALAYAVSARGGCHLKAYPLSHEILRKPAATDRFSFSGKGRIIKIAEDINAAFDSLTACRYISLAASLEEYSRVMTSVTGIPFTGTELAETGERICYNEKVMNFLNGFTAVDDDLPQRFFEEPGTGGDGITIPPINRNEFIETRERYYRIRGLSPNGAPLKEKCEELQLEWIKR